MNSNFITFSQTAGLIINQQRFVTTQEAAKIFAVTQKLYDDIKANHPNGHLLSDCWFSQDFKDVSSAQLDLWSRGRLEALERFDLMFPAEESFITHDLHIAERLSMADFCNVEKILRGERV